jgi:hypothetical protein
MERLSYEDKVIRAFIRDDRLVSIPARDKKRQVILRYLVERCFPEDRTYPEAEVNKRLALYHPDVAALRRYLVEGGLMTRSAGEYRRAGLTLRSSSPTVLDVEPTARVSRLGCPDRDRPVAIPPARSEHTPHR